MKLRPLRWPHVLYGVAAAMISDSLIAHPALILLNVYFASHHDDYFRLQGPAALRLTYTVMRFLVATIPWFVSSITVAVVDMMH